jgi:glycosyltransferase involved in cell wall biosynthesis
VLWIEPYPTRLPEMEDFSRAKLRLGPRTQSSGIIDSPPWVKVLRPRAFPIEPLVGSGFLHRHMWRQLLGVIESFLAVGDCMIAVGKPSELALQALARFPDTRSVYDAMDNFPAFYRGISRVSMEQRERKLAMRVSRILVSSSTLAERFRAHANKLGFALNACATEAMPPVERLRPASARPVLGYVGTVARWFDWRLLAALARSSPSTDVRVIGPIYEPPTVPLPSNVELLPACEHGAAIAAMNGFSVGLIPFKCNDLTASVDPIKYYEYMALGLPVLSSRFGEMVYRDGVAGVSLVDDGADLEFAVRTAIAYTASLSDTRIFRNQNSWDARFDAAGVL